MSIEIFLIAAFLIIMNLVGVMAGQSMEAHRYVSKLAEAYNRGKAEGMREGIDMQRLTEAEFLKWQAKTAKDLDVEAGTDIWMPGNRV